MKRLTGRAPDGTAYLYNMGGTNEAIDRLAAYEDTGLEPEEVEACKVALMGKSLAEIKEIEGISVERMKDLAKAEAEGRLMVLPCKVGDTFWYIAETIGGNGYVTNGVVSCFECMNEDVAVLDNVGSRHYRFWIDRKEAELALMAERATRGYP